MGSTTPNVTARLTMRALTCDTAAMGAYQNLCKRFHRLGVIGDTLGILHWDTATTMPQAAADGRGEQVATLRVLSHELLTDARVGDWLAEAEETPPTEDWARANLREMRRGFAHATALTPALVEAEAKASLTCELAWRGARADSDYASLLPSLGVVLLVTRDIAAAKADALGLAPYDALLDQYEPGQSAARIDAIFDVLAPFLVDFLPQVLEHQSRQQTPQAPLGPFPADRQKALCLRMMAAVGFDFSRGRLDVSHHPFCGGASDDVRITTRYDEADFLSSVMAVLHETGHAMYELDLPAAHRYQPVANARGMAVHESQSLIVEMLACRSPAFFAFAAPLFAETFGEQPAFEPDNLYRLSTRVELGFIRVDADEVSYPAHVILRYRLERALLAGDLELAGLPQAWNDGMEELLGIVPPDDRSGCLQDIHWPSGAFGYFPTYTLGAMMAAQLFATIESAVGNLQASLARGDFAPFTGWLRDHVHAKGSLLSADDLLTEATGRPLDPDCYMQFLRGRYLS